jgi:hypothetical protein
LIQGLTPIGLEYVVGNLRPCDADEIRATVWQGSAASTAHLILTIPGPKWEARTDEGEPAAIGGFVPIWPGLGSGWIWGTDRWDEVVMEVTKALRRSILPSLDRRGLHRLEARPMAANVATIRWLGLVGFRMEAVTPRFGRGGEDFALCARITPDDQARLH